MKRSLKITLLSFCIILNLSCILGPSIYGDEPISNPADKVTSYPYVVTGTANAKTWFLNGDSCAAGGNVTFTAFSDENCILQVSFPMSVGVDENGNCILNGETQLWEIYGVFDEEAQVCHFNGCNNNSDFYATGSLRFFAPAYTGGFNASCRAESNDLYYFSVSSDGLNK